MKFLTLFLILFACYLLFYPVAIIFDRTDTKTLHLTLEHKGMPHEDYPAAIPFLSHTNWPFIKDLAVDSTNLNKIYAKSDNYGTFMSDDGGYTWQPTSKNILSLADNDSYNLQRVNGGLAITHDPTDSNVLYRVNSDTISRSKDDGKTWETIYGSRVKDIFNKPLFVVAKVAYFIFAWISPSGWLLNYTGIDETGYFTTPVVFSPKNPNILYIGTSVGVMRGQLIR